MIESINAIEVFNSRGEKTIKVIIKTEKGEFFSIAPSGASKSSLEPVSLSTSKSLAIFKKIKSEIEGKEEKEIDRILEKIGGKRFEKIGGALAIAISQAVYKSIIHSELFDKTYFPIPLSNVLGGGAHGGYTDIQEFLVFPKKAKSIKEAVETNIEILKELKNYIKKTYGYLGKNDEGAIIAKLDNFKALEIVSEISENFKACIGIDVAATQFYKKGYYFFNGKKYRKNEFIDVIIDLAKTYKIKYIEDPFHEKDFSCFSELTKKLGKNVIICGDDLVSTNPKRVKLCIKKKACNGIIIKPNQVGLVSLALKSVEIAKTHNIIPVASHRSGETEDYFIAEFALFAQCPLLKCSVSGSERFAKWNRLIEIWEKSKKPKMVELKIL
ncbi:MAG TPA: hypothetical protein EYH56_01475 [Nanoarchaeota archaeon]|nr:hypothetical protein [Nanoarchaeota archaeon]